MVLKSLDKMKLRNQTNQGDQTTDCTVKRTSNKDRIEGIGTAECSGGAHQPAGRQSRPADQCTQA